VLQSTFSLFPPSLDNIVVTKFCLFDRF
jgi:hypothetical protein